MKQVYFLRSIITAIIFIAINLNSTAQPGNLDLTFNPNDIGYGFGSSQANLAVYNVEIDANGKLVICGEFQNYDGNLTQRIARLNSNGSFDNTFYGSAFDVVNDFKIQNDGKILIGGKFTLYNSIGINRIARINTDGTLDNTFNPGTGANGEVLSIAYQTDGKILVGGLFTTFNGITHNRIVRLNSDGTIDNTFNSGSGANSTIHKILIQPDGKIIIAGGFTSYNGTTRNRIARLNADGSLDTTFNPNSGAEASILTAALQSDGKILIGGMFNTYDGNIRSYIARINTDGTNDATFNGGANNYVNHITIDANNKIIVTGSFTTFNSDPRQRIARIETNGQLDNTFLPGNGANQTIRGCAILPDGKIVVVGNFTLYNNIQRSCIARINADGSHDINFCNGTAANSTINTVTLQTDGKILIGGSFTSYNDTTINRLARLYTDGELDASFNIGTGANQQVRAIAIQADGKIIVAGDFSQFNGINRNRLVRLNSDGTIDNTFNIGTGANNNVLDVKIQPDGKILIAGMFTQYNGTNVGRIARLNSNGSIDNTFVTGAGANDQIISLSIQSDGKIITCGFFTSFDGTNINRIVRLNSDGSIDNTFNPGTGTNAPILNSLIQPDGKIIIVGNFTSYNSSIRNRIVRLNSDGSIDNTFNGAANNAIKTAILQNDGKVIIGGDFTSYNSINMNRLARLNTDGTLDNTFNVGTGLNNSVNQIAKQADEKIIICGIFTSYNNTGRNRIARILTLNCHPIQSNINVNACNSYSSPSGNYVWTSSGTYIDTVLNSSGCDSIITINLSISTLNTGVTQAANTLSAIQTGVTYQWIDCNNGNAPISGATNQSFTPTVTGSYAVILNDATCSDTSSCVNVTVSPSGLDEHQQTMVLIYPNPATQQLNLQINQTGIIEIYSLEGKLLQSLNANTSHATIEISAYAKGMYLLRFTGNDGSMHQQKFIKE